MMMICRSRDTAEKKINLELKNSGKEAEKQTSLSRLSRRDSIGNPAIHRLVAATSVSITEKKAAASQDDKGEGILLHPMKSALTPLLS
jgi:hypothetical protein